jgi:hypothetical protein
MSQADPESNILHQLICRRTEWSLFLDEFTFIQHISLLFEKLPWLSAHSVTGYHMSDLKQLSEYDMNFSLYLNGTKDFKSTWDQAIVDVLSEQICKNTWIHSYAIIDRSSEEAKHHMKCHHGDIAEGCMDYLYHQRIHKDLCYEDDLTTAYAEKYWAKHLVLAPFKRFPLLEMSKEFATKWHMLHLNGADSHLVVQWLKVS